MKRRFRNGQVPFDPKKVSQSFDVKRFDTKRERYHNHVNFRKPIKLKQTELNRSVFISSSHRLHLLNPTTSFYIMVKP